MSKTGTVARRINPKDFCERSTIRGLSAIFRDWSFMIGTAVVSIWVDQWWFTLLGIWFIGYIQFCLGEALLHEASHYNLFTKRQLHTQLQFLYAYPFFQTLKGFQSEHLQHHVDLMGHSDITMQDYRRYGLYKERPNMFFIWFIKPFLGGPAWYYLKSGPDFDTTSSRLQLVVFWIPVVSLFSLLGALDLLFIYWIIPLIWPFPIYQYWSEIEEHYNTRSGARSNLSGFDNFFKHNEGYHWVHHRYPSVPFYKLKEAHTALAPEGTDESGGFLHSFNQMRVPQTPSWPGHPALKPGPLKDPQA
ncbi:MAG: fatty acid desaturase [Verrucomicrobia bacterium]|nr:fatty acid desaturase [Verrucomicrobiota bacterium]